MTLRTFAFKLFSLLVIVGMLVSNTAVALAQQPVPATPTPQAPAPGTATPEVSTETPPPPAQGPAKANPQAPASFTISGKVTGKDGLPLAGVSVTDDHGNAATTGPDGTYTLPGLQPGAYLVAPKLAGQIFLPYYRAVKLVDKDASGVDFYVPKTDPASVKAPTGQPAGSPANLSHPPSGQASQPANPPDGVSSQALYTVGAPGLAYRYAGQIGSPEQPYPIDPANAITHINTPVGVAADHNGNLLVVEEKGSRVVRFNAAGGSTLSIGTPGVHYTDENGSVFDRLLGVAKQPVTDTIWVAANSLLAEYDADGNLILNFPSDQPWNTGSEDDRFDGARGIAFNDDGSEMYVSDTYNNRVQVFDFADVDGVQTPHYLRSITAGDNGGFNNPWHLTYSDGYVYVADLWNNNIQKCDPSSTDCTTLDLSGAAIDDRGLDLPTSVAFYSVTGTDYMFITDGRNQRVLRCDVDGENCEHFVGTAGEPGSDNEHFFWPDDISVGPAGVIYVADKQNHRIQMFNGGSLPATKVGQRGTTGVPYVADIDGSHLNAPTGLALVPGTGPNSGFYVAEELGMSLVKYDNNGVFQWRSGEPGLSGVGQFTWWGGEPEYTAADVDHFSTVGIEGTLGVDSYGRIYVPDTADSRVVIYLPNGTVFDTIGDGWGNDNDHFSCVTGVSIRPDNGDIYVLDSCDQRILVFDSQRKYKATIGQTGIRGSDSQHFDWPHSIAVDSNGNVYVSDQNNSRVQKCRLSGVGYTCVPFAGVTGVNGQDFRYTNTPFGIAIGPDGLIYVADKYQYRVEVFDPSGAYRTTLAGDWGTNSGNLRNPSGVVVDADNNVYVADYLNSRVVKYSRGLPAVSGPPALPGWTQLNVNGWGEQQNGRATPLVDVTIGTEDYLYAGTINTNGQPGSPRIWRRDSTGVWQPVSDPGFGDSNNNGIVDMIVFNNYLYANTVNPNGAQIWRCPLSSGCDQNADWQQTATSGMDWRNTIFTKFQTFGTDLYVATASNYSESGEAKTDGGEIWKLTGNTWTYAGLTLDEAQAGAVLTDFQSMAEFSGHLLAGTSDWVNGNPAQLWSYDGSTWSPLSQDGIGDTDNNSIMAMAVFGPNLYVGTANNETGAKIYRYDSAFSVTPIITDGFGDTNNVEVRSLAADTNFIYAVTHNDRTGLQIWRSADGTTWNKFLAYDGFGNSLNSQTDLSSSLLLANNRVYVGTWNQTNGGGVWATDPVYTISGTINGVGAGATVTLNPGRRTTLTLAGGGYSFDNIFPGTYTVTPTQHFYTFTPVSGQAAVSAADVTVDFAAAPSPVDLLSPANGAKIDSLLPLTLSWAPISGATKYTLQISTVASLASTWKTVTQAGTTYALSGMKANTIYYWRVRQAALTVGNWSAIWGFTMPAPAAAPTLVSPSTGQILPKDTFTNTFTWKAAVVTTGAPAVQKYHIQISQKTTFDSLDLDEYTLDAGLSYTTPAGLFPNRAYNWRVQAVNTANEFGAWSSVRTFKTLPGQVGLDWIENQDTLQPTFHWHDDWNTGKYTIQICKWPSATSCSVFKAATVTAQAYPLTTSLLPNTQYRWHVQAVGTTGTGSFSDYWNWTTPAPPAVPVLDKPLANEIIPDAAHPDYYPTFSWLPSAGADNYEIQASGDSNFTGTWMDEWTGDTYVSMSDRDWRFYSNTTSWWKVRACGDNGCSVWSTARKLVAKPDQPTGLEQGSDGGTLSFWFWWDDTDQASASSYTIQICKNSGCSSIAKTATITDRYYNMVLSSNTNYYWRVRGNGNTSGIWSDMASFTSPAAPAAPGLIGPANGSMPGYWPTFTWTVPSGATGYELQISRDSTFNWTDYDYDSLTDPIYDWSDNEEYGLWGDTFYWRVRASNSDGDWGPWSASRKLITPAQIQGQVVDPNGNSVSGATVTISGMPHPYTTNPDGWYYDWWIPPGAHTITLSDPGFMTQTQNVTAVNGKTVWADFVRIPQAATGTYRIVLSWPNPDPERDLDAHLWLPLGSNSHISHSNTGSLSAFPNAQLTYDSWGQAEVVDVNTLIDGKYVFAANQSWPTSKSWSGTGVKVEVWKDGALFKACTSPSGSGSWWYAFDMTVASGVPVITCKNMIKTAAPAPYVDSTISGHITQDNGRPMADGVYIDFGNGPQYFDKSPYTISGIGSGDHTITPSLLGWTFNPPSQTVPVGSTDVDFIAVPSASLNTYGTPGAMAVQGDYIYLGNAGRLDAVNTAHKATPDAQGKLWIAENTIEDIAISGDYAYVAQDYSGLSVVNIANPDSPVFTALAQGVVGTAPNTYWTDGNVAQGVAVSGPTVYLAATDSFYTVNVTDPTAPAIVGVRTGDSGFAMRVAAVAGKYAYVVGDYGLQVYDVTNPAKPLGPNVYDNWAEMSDIAVSGNHAYITYYDQGDDNCYLGIFNTDDPYHPYEENRIQLPEMGLRVYASNNSLYVADGESGLLIFELGDNPGNPNQVGTYAPGTSIDDVVALDNFSYVLTDGEMQLVNTSDKSNPTLRSSYTPGP